MRVFTGQLCSVSAQPSWPEYCSVVTWPPGRTQTNVHLLHHLLHLLHHHQQPQQLQQLQVLPGKAEGGGDQPDDEGQQQVPLVGEGEVRVPERQPSLESQQQGVGSAGLPEYQCSDQNYLAM